jgi:lysine-specific demethylase/histidyl-hydroxylase NO66
VTPFDELIEIDDAARLQEAWGRAPVVVAVRKSAQLRPLIVDAIETLARGAFRPPFIRVVKSDLEAGFGEIDPDSFTVPRIVGGQPYRAADAALVGDFVEQHGCTLVLLGLEVLLSRGGALARTVEEGLGDPVDLNLYLTPRSAKGFPRHFDPQHVLLLQLAGRKTWSLWRPERVIAIGEHFEVSHDAGPPLQTVELLAGEALHIPRGWIHSGSSAEDQSIHLTLGLTPRTLAQKIAEASEALMATDVRLRGDGSGVELEDVLATISDRVASPEAAHPGVQVTPDCTVIWSGRA